MRIWSMIEDTVNHVQVGNVFMLDAGGLFLVVFSAWAGRLPILFYFLVIAAANFEFFMTTRILNGFFNIVAQGGGLMFIFNILFFHERARKINIWVC